MRILFRSILNQNPLLKRNYLFHHICFPWYKCIIASRDVSVRRGMTKLDISNVQEDSIPEMTSIDSRFYSFSRIHYTWYNNFGYFIIVYKNALLYIRSKLSNMLSKEAPIVDTPTVPQRYIVRFKTRAKWYSRWRRHFPSRNATISLHYASFLRLAATRNVAPVASEPCIIYRPVSEGNGILRLANKIAVRKVKIRYIY